MFRNYLKTALRVFNRNRMYSFITILGLTTGLWACLVVATVVLDDNSYDRQWSKSADLYRIVTINKTASGINDQGEMSFSGLGPELKKRFPEVMENARIQTSEIRLKLNDNDVAGVVASSFYMDTAVFNMLDFSILAGNPKKYIEGVNNLMITESFRDKFFHGKNPVGTLINEVLTYGEKPEQYLVTGIIKDLPANSHLRAEVIKIQPSRPQELRPDQSGNYDPNYLLLRPGTDIKKFTAKVNKWYSDFVGRQKIPALQYAFQPIKDVYLHSAFARYQKVKGNLQNSYIFSGVALLLLLIACINYVNLSTARAFSRLRETGVRKILGAARRQIIFQFLTESIMFFGISTILSLIIYQLSLPLVEGYIGHQLVLTFFSHLLLLMAAAGSILLVSIIAGIYPALLISGFSPALTLKGNLFSGSPGGHNWLRKGLVVMQFSISIVVLIAMIIVQQQLHFMETADVGYNKNNLLSVRTISWDGKAQAFKNELLRQPGVERVSITSWVPTLERGSMSSQVDDPNRPGNKLDALFIWGDVDVAQTLGLHLKKGRLLSRDFKADGINGDSLQMGSDNFFKSFGHQSCLVTASTAKLLNINTLNVPIVAADSASMSTIPIPVGVVEDFYVETLRDPTVPTFITVENSQSYGGLLVRVKPGAEKQVTASLHTLWKQFFPAKLLDINWVDDLLKKQYEAEKKLQQLFTLFSTLTMALAALGIFGLIVHATAQRTKEIGIRKVLGATITGIAAMLSKDFLKLVFIAIIIATPVAWWAMTRWLQDFAHRIPISWWMMATAGVIALLIALITTSFQAVKAAMVNPVKSLKSE